MSAAAPQGRTGGDTLLVCAMGLERLALARVRPARVERSGVGGAAAASAGRRLAATRPALLASVGFCGGLDPSLRAGDVVVATEVVDQASGRRIPCDPLRASPVSGRRGILTTTVRPLLTPEARREVPGLAVDMESAALAQAAHAAGVPFVAIRAVSDAADASVPDLILLVEGPGSLSTTLAALRPRHAPALARLARGAALAMRSLRRASRQLVAA